MYPYNDPQGQSVLRVSQNYLTCARTIARLIALAGLTPADDVLEIGPGKGHITRALAGQCARVTAVELDRKLYEGLCIKFSDCRNLELNHGDFLAHALPESGQYKVFSNIPFNRTTDIIRKLTEAPNPPREAWLVVEKGAARRFCGKPRESLRSLLLKPYFDARIVYHFRREDFHPMPSVDAVLLRLSLKAQPDVADDQRRAFERFVTAGMNGGLPGLARLVPGRKLLEACREARIPPGANPGDILYIQWLCLYRCMAQQQHGGGHS